MSRLEGRRVELSWWWTTAPEAYDYSYVVSVGRADGEGAGWRLVAVSDRVRFEGHQEPRYHSGLHACVEADTDEALARGLPRRAELEDPSWLDER